MVDEVNHSPGMNEREALANALEKADWPDVSIGNKMLIVKAIETLRAPAQSAWQPDPRTVEECAKIAERSLIGHTLTPGGLARQDEAERIAEDIRALLPSSDRGGVG